MPEEAKDPRSEPQEKKAAYQPPVLIEYGSIVQLTGGKSTIGADMLPGTRR